MSGACSAHREIGNTYKVLVGCSETEDSIGRPSHEWENNIKSDIKEIGLMEFIWPRMKTRGGLLLASQ